MAVVGFTGALEVVMSVDVWFGSGFWEGVPEGHISHERVGNHHVDLVL